METLIKDNLMVMEMEIQIGKTETGQVMETKIKETPTEMVMVMPMMVATTAMKMEI